MKVSVLTPTFNRAGLLETCYKSLCSQTYKDFEWIIIDDGSTDDTAQVVADFQKQNKIEILYFYKENGGKHTAINYALPHLKGDITLILDSDDYLDNKAIEIVLEKWQKYWNNAEVGCVCFLRAYFSGQVIGDSFPNDNFLTDYIEITNKGISGDKMETFKTSVLTQFPFPVFQGEKFLGESVIWLRIAQEFRTVGINQALYYTEYLPGGLTMSGRKMRLNNPLGGMEYARAHLTCKRIKRLIKIKMLILFRIYELSAKNKKISYKKLPKKYWYSFLLYPIAWIIFVKWNKGC